MKAVSCVIAVVVLGGLCSVEMKGQSGHTGDLEGKYGENQKRFQHDFHSHGPPFRSGSGRPGKEYWQNAADYEIDVELKEEEHMISGSLTITYTNNSPHDLDFLWLQLEQNKFRPDSRGRKTTRWNGSRFRGDTTQGYGLSNVRVNHQGSSYEADYSIYDTRMKVRLNDPLKKAGNKLELSMDFKYEIPKYGADRMGRLETEAGWIYQLAQWYPRMAVFDDIRGWNNEPYLGTGEFYLEYGDFDLELTVPYDHIVVSSGVLQNPGEVLTDEQEDRMEKAENSDTAVHIIKPGEAGDPEKTRPMDDGKVTWHYVMENARDVSWASSPAFIWDAAKIDPEGGDKATAMSVYPEESNGDTAWGRSTEYLKHSIEHYSEQWYPYPYETAVNVAGRVGGMEYPGLSFCSWKATEGGLWGVTDHEFGHIWFPMIVGSNERLYAWMDEGLNTFINHYSTRNFNDGEYDADLSNMDKLVPALTDDDRERIHTYPDVLQPKNLGMAAYGKPAVGLYLLREYVLGKKRFDEAFRAYIDRWAYKHPAPADFFNTIEDVAGEELDWFWKSWFYSNDVIDQAVQDLSYVDGSPKKGALITVSNEGGVPLPLEARIVEENGEEGTVRMPVEIWKRGNEWTFRYESSSKIDSVQLDPANILPDVNPGNDAWPYGE